LLLGEPAQDAALAKIELTDRWGVAGQLAARLTALGIKTPLALKRADPRSIRKRFNFVLERLVLELRISLEEAPPDRKSIMASRYVGRTVQTREELEEAVATYTSRAARKTARTGARSRPDCGLCAHQPAYGPIIRNMTRTSPWHFRSPHATPAN
jgi:DNA polymerase V